MNKNNTIQTDRVKITTSEKLPLSVMYVNEMLITIINMSYIFDQHHLHFYIQHFDC